MGKTWTADSIEMIDKMAIKRWIDTENDDAITFDFIQQYRLLDSDSEPIEALGVKKIIERREQSTVPTDILAALNTIKNFLEAKAYEQEGMEP